MDTIEQTAGNLAIRYAQFLKAKSATQYLFDLIRKVRWLPHLAIGMSQILQEARPFWMVVNDEPQVFQPISRSTRNLNQCRIQVARVSINKLPPLRHFAFILSD